MGDVPDLPRILEGLATDWEFARNTCKPCPPGIVFHAVIDAGLDLRQRVPAEAVESVVVEGDQLLLDRGDRIVRTARDSRVSIHHYMAVSMLRGAAGVAEFETPAVQDPALAALRAKVRVRLDAALPRGAARVTLRDTAGREHVSLVTEARGSAGCPMTDHGLEAKFRQNAAMVGREEEAGQWCEEIWRLERMTNLASFVGSFASP